MHIPPCWCWYDGLAVLYLHAVTSTGELAVFQVGWSLSVVGFTKDVGDDVHHLVGSSIDRWTRR